MKVIYQFQDYILKVGQNGLGQWGVYQGNDGTAKNLVYLRFFKSEEIAEKWAKKYLVKMNVQK